MQRIVQPSDGSVAEIDATGHQHRSDELDAMTLRLDIDLIRMEREVQIISQPLFGASSEAVEECCRHAVHLEVIDEADVMPCRIVYAVCTQIAEHPFVKERHIEVAQKL